MDIPCWKVLSAFTIYGSDTAGISDGIRCVGGEVSFLFLSILYVITCNRGIGVGGRILRGLCITRATIGGFCISDIGRRGLVRSTVHNVLGRLSPRSSCAATRRAGGLARSLRKSFRNINVRFGISRSALLIVRAVTSNPSRHTNLLPNSHVIDIGSATVTNIGVDHRRVVHHLHNGGNAVTLLNIIHHNVTSALSFQIGESGVPIGAVSTTCVVAPDVKCVHVNSFNTAARSRFLSTISSLRSDKVHSLVVSRRNGNNKCLRSTMRVTGRFLGGNSLVMCARNHVSPQRGFFTSNGNHLARKRIIVLLSRCSTSTTRVLTKTVRSSSHNAVINQQSCNGNLIREPVRFASKSVVHLAITRCCAPSKQYVRGPCARKNGSSCCRSVRRHCRRNRFCDTSDVRFPSSLHCCALHRNHIICNNNNVVPSCFIPLSALRCAHCRHRLSTGNVVLNRALGCTSGGHGTLGGRCHSLSAFVAAFAIPRDLLRDVCTQNSDTRVRIPDSDLHTTAVPVLRLRIGTLVTESL